MKLYPRVLEELDHYFSMRGLTYLLGQRELLAQAVEAILQAAPGTVTAIPFQPGLGKSTLIRALLAIFSREFQKNTSIAQTIGGVIVVVEKTAEAEDLEELCNEPGDQPPVAKAISAPNDYNLAQGKCPNGTATSYQECPGKSCSDYSVCELAQSANQIHDTPILILLHARYQRYMENMTPFLTWEDDAGQYRWTLLLVDELPPMVEDNALSLEVLNKIESELDQFKPCYHFQSWKEKTAVLYEWSTTMRVPYFKLAKEARKSSGMYSLVSRRELEEAGFIPEKLENLTLLLANYLGTTDHRSIQLANVFRTTESVYYAVGQGFSLFAPRLRKLCGDGQPATFLFSGTASLSPELSQNPEINAFSDCSLESFQRLTIKVERGDLFNASRSGLSRKQSLPALVAWLQFIVPQLSRDHKQILVVTYKSYSKTLWNALDGLHDVLIPYIGPDGEPRPMLPYFGGMNGSNLYRESTCVICVGLNRFEPKDYISRTLALDFDGQYKNEIDAAMTMEESRFRLDSLPCVMDTQDITLARDIVQLIFRSALRNHGETEPIELWLLQPPNGVARYLQDYFMDCQVQECTELPESCQLAAAIHKEYLGQQTHAGKLLDYLGGVEEGVSLTPAQIRTATGLTPEQFKEAKKHRNTETYRIISKSI